MIKLPPEFKVTKSGSATAVRAAEAALNKALPEDYLAFLTVCDGGEGFAGEHYLVLWSAEDLHQFNVEYEFPIYAPALIAFGSDGGGEAFAFDTRSTPYRVVMVPFIGMSNEDAIPVATNFTSFLERLRTDESLF